VEEQPQPEKLDLKYEREIKVVKCRSCGADAYGVCFIGNKVACIDCFTGVCDDLIRARDSK
jgi:hypothetical protein